MWQTLYAELKDSNFIVIAVALESRGNETAGAWIEQANPEYPCLIDVDHNVAALYNMINVPQAVWIDERGKIVRPTETAGATEGFRKMNLETFTMPDAELQKARQTRQCYLDAIRDWVRNGEQSEHIYSAQQARDKVSGLSSDAAMADAWFRLGLYLYADERQTEGLALMHKASDLHPESWSIWRQTADLEEVGKSMGAEFWARVEVLGEKHYYAPIDIKGIPE